MHLVLYTLFMIVIMLLTVNMTIALMTNNKLKEIICVLLLVIVMTVLVKLLMYKNVLYL